MSDTRLPDSRLARLAERYVAELSPPFLHHHCVRTFLLADAVGRRQGLSYDRELLYLGSLLHDLGLVDRFDSGARFEVAGADAARRFLLVRGLSEEKADIVWDAIALHTSIGISDRKRPEIALVAVGAGMDVAGLGLNAVDPIEVELVMADYPRLGLERAIMELVIAHARRQPMAAAFTWVAEVARPRIEGWPCPTFQDVVDRSPFLPDHGVSCR